MGIKRYNVTEEDGSIQPYDVDDNYYDNFKIDHPNHEGEAVDNPIPPAIGPSPDFGKATAEEAAPAWLKKQKVAMGSVSEDGSSESADFAKNISAITNKQVELKSELENLVNIPIDVTEKVNTGEYQMGKSFDGFVEVPVIKLVHSKKLRYIEFANVAKNNIAKINKTSAAEVKKEDWESEAKKLWVDNELKKAFEKDVADVTKNLKANSNVANFSYDFLAGPLGIPGSKQVFDAIDASFGTDLSGDKAKIGRDKIVGDYTSALNTAKEEEADQLKKISVYSNIVRDTDFALSELQYKQANAPETITQEDVNSWNELINTRDTSFGIYKDLYNTLGDSLDNVDKLESIIDITSRSYKILDIVPNRISSSVLTLAAGLTDFAAETTAEAIYERFTGEEVHLPVYLKALIPGGSLESLKDAGLLNKFTGSLREGAERLDSKVRKRQLFENIEGVSDFGNFVVDLMSDQVVNTAVTLALPTAGLLALSASAAGSKFHEMNMEIADGQKISGAQFYSAGLIYGLGEYITERVSLGQARGMLNTLGLSKKAFKKALTISEDFTLDTMDWSKAALNYGIQINKEGGGEAISALFANFADKYILDKDIAMTDGLLESYVSGGLMSGLGFSAPQLISDLGKAFTNSTGVNKLNERSRRIIEIRSKIDKIKPNITGKYNKEDSDAIGFMQEELDNLVAENLRDKKEAESRIENLSDNNKRQLLDIDVYVYKLKSAIDNINANPKLDADTKKGLVNEQSYKISLATQVKDNILDNAQFSKGKELAIRFQQEVAAKNGMEFLNIVGSTSEDAIRLGEEAVALEFDRLAGLNEDGKLTDAQKEQQKNISGALKDIGTENNISSANGWMIGAEYGFPMSFAVEGSSLRNNRGATILHEAGHATVFNKLISKGADMVSLAKLLEDYMVSNYKGAKEKFEEVNKAYPIGEFKAEVIAEEKMAIMLEYANTVNYEKDRTFSGKVLNKWQSIVGGSENLESIKTGQDVFNLLTSFERSWRTSEAHGLFKSLASKDINVLKTQDNTQKPSTGRKLSITREADKAKTALDNIPYSELQSGVSQSAIGRELPGMVKAQIGRFNLSKQARQDFIDVVVAKMFIEKETTKWGTNPKGEEMLNKGTLYGFLNGRIALRIKDVVRKEYKRNPEERIYLAGIDTNQFETLDKAANVVDEAPVDKKEEAPKYKSLSESRVVSKDAVIDIKKKVLSTVRTLKSAINASVSINKTVTPLIAEIKKELGKQVDINLKEEMGGKKDAVLEKYLLKNKKAILENMTTTWLMTAMPQAVQKQVDGKFTSDWEGKKIDREKTTTNQAGKTSGADIVRRRPNVANALSDADFLAYIIGKDGNPIRGRKESLAKAMAEEISLEIFNTELQNEDSDISKAFENNQALKGVVLADNYIAEVAKQSERGNVKFSLTTRVADIILKNEKIIKDGIFSRFSNGDVITKNRLAEVLSALNLDLTPKEIKNFVEQAENYIKRFIDQNDKTENVGFADALIDAINSNNVLTRPVKFLTGIDLRSLGVTSQAGLFRSMFFVGAHRKLMSTYISTLNKEGAIRFLKWHKGHTATAGASAFLRKRNQITKGSEDLMNLMNEELREKGIVFSGTQGKNGFVITTVTENGVSENIKDKLTTPEQAATKQQVVNGSKSTVNISKKDFENEGVHREAMAKEAKDELLAWLSFVKKEGTVVDWVMTMMSLKSNMGSMLKAAASVKYYVKDGYENGLNRYEHLISTDTMVRYLTAHFFGIKKIDLDILFDKYKVAIIPIKMDDDLNVFRQNSMGVWDYLTQLATDRYYGKPMYGYKNIVPIEVIVGEDKGNIIGEEFVSFNSILKEGVAKTVAENIVKDKALANGRSVKMSLSPKKIRVFDFDDTLAITDSKVLYTMPNPNTGFSPESVKQKAIFMVGGPGAGKTNVGKGLQLGRQGYKVVNQDIALEAMKKESGLPGNESDYNEAQRSTRSVLGAAAKKAAVDKFDKYAKNGDGMVIDGTGASYNATMKKVKQLEDSGYEVHMVIANTPLETALARNKARTERSLPSFIVEKTWKQVDESSELYRKDFGDRLYEINTESIEYGKALPVDFLQTVYEGINKNIAGKIDAATFAKEAGTMESLGAEWNFAEFSKIVDGKEGPLLEVAKIIADKRGTKDVFVLTARPSEAAVPIKKFLASMGLDIPIKNITGLGDGSPKAKADWITGKFAEGYNDFYFADDHTGNVKAVKDVLNALDVKSKVQQSRVKFSLSLDKEFNAMIERNKGVRAETTFSDIVAKKRGKDIGRFKLWMPSSLDDFKGLTSYVFSGSGRQGDADMEFFKKALIDPYFSGVGAIETAKQTIKNDFKALNKLFKPTVKKLGDIVPGTSYTYDQAIRVNLWTKAGYEIPGISKRDLASLNDIVSKDPELSTYSDGLLLISKNDKWGEPNDFWDVNTILSDLNNMTEKAGRKTYIAEFIENVDVIFSDKNLNKIEALYGTRQRDALEDAIYRMKNGTNRPSGTNKIVNVWNNWVNNSTGAIMFFNRKSAALQLISTVNFMNWSDNNPLKAAAAFANQPQYWKDWATIFNSDKLKQRRSGLKSDVNEAEIANAAANSTNKAQAALSYLLKIGFTPTQIADSFAIASGGASFYRNRINTYKAEYIADGDKLKRKYTDKEAEEKAWKDFSQVSDETQQSSDPALISMEQASVLGRLVLTFQNTAIQLNRSIKKSSLDLYKRRRTKGLTQFQSDASNLSKVIYYGAIQNIIFTSLQAALFSLIPGFDDDDDDDEENAAAAEKKVLKGVNSVVDTMLKGGFGLKGAVVSTVKNMVIEYAKQEKKEYNTDHTYTILQAANLSPPIGSKLSKIYGAIQTKKFDQDVINDRGFSVTIDGKVNISPSYSVLGSVVSGTINLPLDRAITEVNSLAEAFDARNTAMQRIALGLGLAYLGCWYKKRRK
jgi:predicted kinase